jgi:hypothetical protein
MGTRNLTIVINNGKTKVAQYGQWDGYPDGQGRIVLKFLKHCNFQEFKERLEHVSFLTSKELRKIFTECSSGKRGKHIDSYVFESKYPELSRSTGAGVLQLIYDKKAFKLWDRKEFANNSLFCEWAYVIDLDKEQFEVYQGFNKKPLTSHDRFYNNGYKNNKYYPIKIAKSYSLKKLPEVRKFCSDFAPYKY